MNEIDMPIDYHAWGAMLECYQRYRPKLTNSAELTDYFDDNIE